MVKRFTKLIFISAFLISSTINGFAEDPCKPIKQDLPKQFLSFEKHNTSNVIVAFHNNSKCSVFVQTDDLTPTISLEGRLLESDERLSKSVIENVVYPLRYYLKVKHSRSVKPRDKWQHSVFVIEIPPGKKMLFSVSQKMVRVIDRFLVKFSYQMKPTYGVAYPDLILSEKIGNIKRR